MAGTWKADPTSWRTAPRPKGWKKLRAQIIARDGGRCTWVSSLKDGGSWRDWAHVDRCPLMGTDVDHMGDPSDHHPDMLRLLCPSHHNKRSSEQAVAARRIKQAQRKRAKPKHPGLID